MQGRRPCAGWPMPTEGEPAVARGSSLAAQLRQRLASPFVRALDALVSSLAHQPLQLFLVGGVVRDLLDTTDPLPRRWGCRS